MAQTSFLAIEGCHVLVTGASGGVGSAAVQELLRNGCKVSALDKNLAGIAAISIPSEYKANLFPVQGDLKDERSVAHAVQAAADKFGPPQILIANAGVTDESSHPPIWEIDTERWDKVHSVNVRGTFLTIKHFLLAVKDGQESSKKDLDNIAIVITGSETGVFGQEGHAEYASGKAGLQYGLVKTVKNEIVRLNSKARVNAVAPGWINTALIGDRLDDPHEKWAESEATVALRKIAEPEDVARCMAFLASHRAAGHISGQCISVDGGQEGRLLWREERLRGDVMLPASLSVEANVPLTSQSKRKRRMRICLSVDFDAISACLGTGHVPENTVADYSAGEFSARVGVNRLLKVFRKHKMSDKVTWFIPGHSMETFPNQTEAVVQSGAEIALHGYSHEGASAMTIEQERDVLEKCIELASSLPGNKRPVGYRAPLYQIRESTVNLLQEHGFLYDSSMNAHDALPYLLPHPFTGYSQEIPDYSKEAKTWMTPSKLPARPDSKSQEAEKSIVEIPGSWYTEDITPLGFYPYSSNTHGYVSVDDVEKMWWDRFDWLWENESWLDEGEGLGFGSVYPLIWHPESAGRSHVIGMMDRFIGRLAKRISEAESCEITFETMSEVATSWKKDA